MFNQLKQLIEKRPITITVASLRDGRIRVNVVPQASSRDTDVNSKIKFCHKSEVAEVPESALKALTTPLSLTGTPAEVDAALPQALLQYSEAHLQLQQTLDQAQSQISEAVKAIDEREKAKAKPKPGTANKSSDKPEHQKEKEKPEEVGLLPLWCKPRSDRAGTEPGQSGAPAPATTQDSLPQLETGDVTTTCH